MKIGIIIFIIAAMLGAATTIKMPTNTQDWLVYHNDQYGFELKYPRDLVLGKIDRRVNPNLIFSLFGRESGDDAGASAKSLVIKVLPTGEVFSTANATGWQKASDFVDTWRRRVLFPNHQVQIELEVYGRDNQIVDRLLLEQVLATLRFVK